MHFQLFIKKPKEWVFYTPLFLLSSFPLPPYLFSVFILASDDVMNMHNEILGKKNFVFFPLNTDLPIVRNSVLDVTSI